MLYPFLSPPNFAQPQCWYLPCPAFITHTHTHAFCLNLVLFTKSIPEYPLYLYYLHRRTLPPLFTPFLLLFFFYPRSLPYLPEVS